MAELFQGRAGSGRDEYQMPTKITTPNPAPRPTPTPAALANTFFQLMSPSRLRFAAQYRSRSTTLLTQPQRSRSERALVQPVQALLHPRPKQRIVGDAAQVLGDEPHALLCRHPLQVIEPRQLHRPRESAQRAL